MREQVHYIISIAKHIGHPDIFITMTCDPKWPDITSALLPVHTPLDRPDLSVRLFRINMRAFLQLLIEEEIIGKVMAHVWGVEFQKRDLSHANTVFFLDSRGNKRFRSAENVKSMLSSEIPSLYDPTLRELALNLSIHNPCGPANPL